jgi:hypothetical protein
MPETSDLLIFWIIVAPRFLAPLAIPRFPLPAILAALIIDDADQSPPILSRPRLLMATREVT